jgi:uncharacterized C2H2 Zn-finger protein
MNKKIALLRFQYKKEWKNIRVTTLKCKDCDKQFRERKSIDNHQLSHDYIFGKQTLQQNRLPKFEQPAFFVINLFFV